MTALQTKKRVRTERATFRVASHCRLCAVSLERALSTTDGIRFALVLPVSGETVVDYDPTVITAMDVHEAIEAAGFSVGNPTHHSSLDGSALEGSYLN